MGWYFEPSGGIFQDTRKEFAEDMVRRYRGEDYSLKPSDPYKGTLYILTKNDEGQRYIAVLFLDQEDDGTWGYKPMSEMVGPCVYDCPKRLLDKSEVPDTYGWRKKCHEYRIAKKAA